MQVENFTLMRGDSAPFGGQVTITSSGIEVPYAISNTAVLRFSAKHRYADADSKAVFSLTSPDRITVVDGPNGVIEFTIEPDDYLSASPGPLAKPLALLWDLQVSDAAATNVYTLARGQLFIEPDVTIAAP